jgi:D-apionolactonase
MTTPSRQQLLDGKHTAPDEPLELRAGAFHLLYDNGTLRHITVNGMPVLHQVYAAVRDHNWGTVVGVMRDVEINIGANEFEIRYTMLHQQRDIDFVWQANITGTADSQITFTFNGKTNNTFKTNRTGFCILHPMALAGKACVVEHIDGTTTDGYFPDLISPHQPFFNIRAIQHQVLDGVGARVLMEGDTFEMEDQRNWIDASYKTYCTPLSLPFPKTVHAGETISQTITLSLTGNVPQLERSQETLTVTITDKQLPLRQIGIGLPSHGELPNETEIRRLQALNLAHLRADIHFTHANTSDEIDFAEEYARQLQLPIEFAVFVSENGAKELNTFAALVQALQADNIRIARIAIFHREEKSTRRHWVELTREKLSHFNVPLGAGTNAFFTELNRERPPADLLDFVIYSVNPQVHAFDNLSLVEALQTHVETVRTARSFSENAKIVVSPVTFKMRFNPNATGADASIPAGELPSQVDPRQMSLFGAGWTLGSIKYLAESGVHSATYYETTGWRGLMETANGSPVPEKFASTAGTVFPMYHVFRALADFSAGQVQVSQSSQPLKVECLVLRKGEQQRILLANLTASIQRVTLSKGTYTLRLLDATNALQDPDEFWQLSPQIDISILNLPPYALAILDKVQS